MSSVTSTIPRPMIANRAYEVEVLKDNQWISVAPLIMVDDLVQFAGNHVDHFLYNPAVNSAALNFRVNGRSCHANIIFSDAGRGFLGTYLNEHGDALVMRGRVGYKELYSTKRKPKDTASAFEPWLSFGIETYWENFNSDDPNLPPKLRVKYTLGEYDISNRTAVTNVDRPKGITTIEMVKASLPDLKKNSPPATWHWSFSINLESGGETFAGTLHQEVDFADQPFDLIGRLDDLAARERSSYFTASAAHRLHSSAGSSIQTPEQFYAGADLSLINLENVSPIQVVTNPKGEEVICDAAQAKSGQYFNESLINGLDDDWIKKLFGSRNSLPARVQGIFAEHLKFFGDNSVLGTGQLLYSNLGATTQYQKTLERVKPEALKQGWQSLSEKQTAPEYQKVTNSLYIEGYRDGVTGIQPYLQDAAGDWGRRYYDFVVSDPQLTIWQVQILSGDFKNVQERMYNWYTKLAILNPDGSDLPAKMLSTVYAALLGCFFSEAKWDSAIAPFLKKVIENAHSADTEKLDFTPLEKKLLEDNKQALNDMLACFQGSIDIFCEHVILAFKHYEVMDMHISMMEFMTDPNFLALVGDGLEDLEYKAWTELSGTTRCLEVLSGIGYALGGAAIIWGIFMNSQDGMDFEKAIEDMSLGVLALGAFTKSIESAMNVGIGDWMRKVALKGDGRLAEFAGDMAQWFAKNGEVVPVGRAGKFFTALFGKNSAEFFAKRIAPALAIMGVVLSAMSLFHHLGDRTAVLFDSLNMFFALADVTCMFLSYAGFAWAGAVGFGFAMCGLVVVIAGIIYNIFRAKPDPVRDFVNGPMTKEGFAAPA